MQELVLTDLIDVQVLQKIQNGFSKFTGMAALITDAEGNPVTEGSSFTDFCMRLTRATREGLARCAECDRRGALLTLEKGEPVVYHCHAGLMDFAAPIMVEGSFVGSFIGGQVCTTPLREDEIRKTADELGIDAETYIEAAAKVQVLEYEQVQQAAEFLSEIAAVLSEMAYSSYRALQQSRKLERVVRSHNRFIVDMNANMKQHVQDWINTAKGLNATKLDDTAFYILKKLMDKGDEFLATIDDTVEYSKIASGEIELRESEYDISELIEGVRRNFRDAARKKGDEIVVTYEENVPKLLLGDAGRINQIVTRFVRNAIRYTENGTISIHVSCVRRSYATDLIIKISDTGREIDRAALETIQKIADKSVFDSAGEGMAATMIPLLVEKMSGTLQTESVPGKGTAFIVCIPQLDVRNKV